MNPDEIKNLLRNQTPVDIVMNSGEVYHIPHPEFAHVSPNGESVTIYDTTGGWFLNSLATLNIASINKVKARRPATLAPRRRRTA